MGSRSRGSYSFVNGTQKDTQIPMEPIPNGTQKDTQVLNVQNKGLEEFDGWSDDPFQDLTDQQKSLMMECKKEKVDFERFQEYFNPLNENGFKPFIDKNGMNIFHVLLFNEKEKDWDWYTKDLDKENRKNTIKIMELIFEKIPQLKGEMVIKKDNFGRTPLHYAGIVDGEAEDEESSIALALMKNGADMCLFEPDRKKEKAVNLISTEILKKILDSKLKIKGAAGHPNQTAYCDIEILQPIRKKEKRKKKQDEKTVEDQKPTKYPLKMDYLQNLICKHQDLFDHHVISALIW